MDCHNGQMLRNKLHYCRQTWLDSTHHTQSTDALHCQVAQAKVVVAKVVVAVVTAEVVV